MKFGPVPIADASGKILGHNVAGPDGRRALRKGRQLNERDIARLRAIGRASVYVAELTDDDIAEDAAARQIATAVCADAGATLRLSGSSTGRVNVHAQTLGVLRVAVATLEALNDHDGVTLATLPHHSVVTPGKMVATLKIIPYAIPAATVAACVALPPLLRLTPLPRRSVRLLLSGFPTAEQRIVTSFDNALRPRLDALNAALDGVAFVPLEDESGELALAQQLMQQVQSGADLIILAGETAIMDRNDIAPRAVERAGGRIIAFGAPVDPGNLLLLATLDGVPILGAPGCARSPKANIVDLLLPRLLAGDVLTRRDIVQLAHGGLLEDVPERPLPRSQVT